MNTQDKINKMLGNKPLINTVKYKGYIIESDTFSTIIYKMKGASKIQISGELDSLDSAKHYINELIAEHNIRG